MAVASLVLGIIAIVFPFVGLGIIGLISGIVGLILGIMAKKKNPSGIATAGLVCSIIGVAITLLVLVACAACIGNAACALSALS